MRDPRRSRSIWRDETIDIAVLCRQVEWHHHGAERPQILDPRRLFEKRREVVVSKNEDRMLRHVAREYHRVRPRLVRLVRNAVKRREVKHVPRSGGHNPVETARLHGVKQTVEVAKALRQRRTREGIGGHRARCVHDDASPWHAMRLLDRRTCHLLHPETTDRRRSPHRHLPSMVLGEHEAAQFR
jgi:hypothetical protein